MCFGVPRSEYELYRLATMPSAPEDFEDSPVLTHRLSMVASRIWFAHTLLLTYMGLSWDLSVLELSLVILTKFWKFFRVTLIVQIFRDHSFDQPDFAKNTNQRGRDTTESFGGWILDSEKKRFKCEVCCPTTSSHGSSATYTSLRRQDTEADIGLQLPRRRWTSNV